MLLPKNADRLRAPTELALLLFTEQDYKTRHQPLQPPRCNGKGRRVHSVLRSDVEQRSFAHTVSPLGALLLPLSDVGRKTKGIRTTHQSHWHGLRRIAQTAVAPQSCLSFLLSLGSWEDHATVCHTFHFVGGTGQQRRAHQVRDQRQRRNTTQS